MNINHYLKHIFLSYFSRSNPFTANNWIYYDDNIRYLYFAPDLLIIIKICVGKHTI
jgi:hypothetical protein